jgi:hypothetical protein
VVERWAPPHFHALAHELGEDRHLLDPCRRDRPEAADRLARPRRRARLADVVRH